MKQVELERHLRWLMMLRVVTVATLLFSAFAIELLFSPAQSLRPLFLLAAISFGMVLFYAVLDPWLKGHRAFAYLQLFGDVVIITIFVRITGGLDSPMSFLYLLPIAVASLMLFRSGALVLAAACFASYTALILVGEAVFSEANDPARVIYFLVAHLVAMVAVAVLAAYLAERLRRQGHELDERRGAVARLQALNENIIESINSGLLTTDLSGRINFINRGGIEITGLTQEDVTPVSIDELLGLGPDFLHEIRKRLLANCRYRFEKYFDTKAGRRIFLGIAVSNLNDKIGRPLGFIFIFQDLTEIHALEQQVRLKERMAALGQMAAGMAHELRNPLAAISGAVQYLRGEFSPTGEALELMDIILRESDRLDQAIRDFLTFTRPGEFAAERVDLVQLTENNVKLLRKSREFHRGHRVATRYESERMDSDVDPNRLKQIFWNLATNALKAMPDGGRLEIEVSWTSGGDEVEISFVDNGVGMDAAQQKLYFQPFSSSFPEGTGLGAAIVYRVVEEHGGKIHMESGAGAGTRVRIVLPRFQSGVPREEAPDKSEGEKAEVGILSRILVVEDEKSMRDLLAMMLRKEGHAVETAESAEVAQRALGGGGEYNLLISDISMPGMSGLELLRYSRGVSRCTEVILMTAYGSKQTAIEALNEGACYYVEKPFDLDEMKAVVRRTLEQQRLEHENEHLRLKNQDLQAELTGKYEFDGLVGCSPKMNAIFQLIRRVASTGSTIMISGESGTGKELIARAIHYNSGRKELPFVSINCGALPDDLLESELFGHMKGSFTGATNNKKGLFEAADGGTIFLDEIGETSPAMQIKLLRVLQERRIRHVGGTVEIPVNVRVITATNQDLERMVREKQFREDLYYRINVIAIRMPALREKREDIPALAEHFLEKYRDVVGKPISGGISKAAMECLESYDWPGNVRQLENVIERSVAMETTDEIRPESFSPEVREGRAANESVDVDLPESGIDLEQHLEALRQRYMREAMERSGGVQTRAAELLGMTFRSFRYFAKKYGLTRESCALERSMEEAAELSGEAAR